MTASVRNRRHRNAAKPPRFDARLARQAVADPLSAMWTELNWLVTDDPWMDHSLMDVDRVISLLNQPDEPAVFTAPPWISALDAIDIDAILNQLRMRRAIEAARTPKKPADGLDMYLRGLRTRGPPEPQGPLEAAPICPR